LPAGWEKLMTVCRRNLLTGRTESTEPIGMRGSRLESRIHIISKRAPANEHYQRFSAPDGNRNDDVRAARGGKT